MRNQKIKRWLFNHTAKIFRKLTIKHIFPHVYNESAKKPVDENKIVIIAKAEKTLRNSFGYLYDYLRENYDYHIHVHFILDGNTTRRDYSKRVIALMRDAGDAKVIFIDDSNYYFSYIDIRKETQLVNLWHGCGAFKRFGHSTEQLVFGMSTREFDEYPIYKGINTVTVSSPEVMWAFEEALGKKREENVVKPLGVSRTDNFFDSEYIKTAYDELYRQIPQAKGKKVILYAPTFRGRVKKAKAPDRMNIELMMHELGDDYIMIIKQHPFVKNPPPVLDFESDFAFEMTEGGLSIDQMMCVSDIMITDYSSTVFEYSLFLRPMIFLAYDLDDYCDWRGFYYDYDQITPGPVFNFTREVIDYIKNIDTLFDSDEIVKFRDKFMSACDGHSTERILFDTLGESLNSHRLSAKNEKCDYHLLVNADDFEKNGYDFEKIEKRGKKEVELLKKSQLNDRDKNFDSEVKNNVR